MLLAKIPCWLPASRPETMPEWFSAAPWTSSATPSLTLLCRSPHLDPSGKYQCSPHPFFYLLKVVLLFLLFLSNKHFWLLSGMRKRATWSWLRLCPAGCSRRPESWGWEMLLITVLESPSPLQLTPSPTLWWVVSRSPWECVVSAVPRVSRTRIFLTAGVQRRHRDAVWGPLGSLRWRRHSAGVREDRSLR